MPNETIKQLEHVPASNTIDASSAVPGSQGPDAAVGGEESASLRGSSTVEQGAHNPKAAGSTPAPATFEQHNDSPTATRKKRKKRSRGLLAWFTARDE